MCLNVPGKVVEVGEKVVLDYSGERRVVEMSLVDLGVGDWAIVSGGVIVSRVDEEKAKGFLEVLDEGAA